MIPNQEHIDALIAAYLQGLASAEEQKELESWLAESAENKAYFNDLEFVFHATASVSQESLVDAEVAWEKVIPQLGVQKGKRVFLNWNTWQMAAAFIGLALVSVMSFWLLNQENEPALYSYTSDESEVEIYLPDSTLVRLAPHSRIAALEVEKDRGYELKGKAYFQIMENEEQFILQVGDLQVLDIGTAFTVSSEKDTTFVSVEEGEVQLIAEEIETVHLKKGESGYFVPTQQKMEKQEQTAKPELLGTFSFEEKSLQEIVDVLSAYFGKSIYLDNPALEDCSISVNFNGESLLTILDIIALTHDLNLVEKEGAYHFTGSACN